MSIRIVRPSPVNTGNTAEMPGATRTLFTQPDVTPRRTGKPGGEKAKPSPMQPLEAAALSNIERTPNHAASRQIIEHEMCDAG